MKGGVVREVYLPCESFPVRFVLGPRPGLSNLERLVLEAVHEGVDNFDELVRIFQIGYRPTLHLVADMWHNGYLYLDTSNGLIQIASHARERIGTEREGELQGGQRSSRTVSVMQDLIAGQIFPEKGRPLQHPGEHLLPMVLDRGTFRRCEQTAIRDALRQSSGFGEDPAGQDHILSVHLPLASLTEETGGAALRYLKLKVSCSMSPSGRLRISLLHPAWIERTLRRRLESQLVCLADERPNEPVFQMLRESAAVLLEEQAEGEGLDTYCTQFRMLLDDLTELTPAGGREFEEARLRQLELESLIDLVLDELQKREKQRLRTKILEGLESIDGAITTAIGEAKIQVVLSCPAVYWSRFRNYIQVIERALKKGVRIFVLWGLTPDEELEAEIKNAFIDLKRKGDFRWSRYSLRTNGRFFLKDFDLAVFTGVNFLGPARFASPALAVLVQGESAEGKRWDRCRVVLDQLEQVGRTALESDIAHGLILPEASLESGYDKDPLCDNRPEIPASTDQAYGASFFEAWRAGWLDCGKQLEERLGRLGLWSEVVSGGRHREIMERLLSQCSRRLVLGSALVASRGLDPLLTEALRKVARAKVSGLILYGEVPQEDEAALDRLRQLINDFPVQFIIARVPLHGGVLIADDTLLLTSFSFLARDGYEPVTERRLRRLETGLLLHGAEVADAVAASLFKAAGHSHARRATPTDQLKDAGQAAQRPQVARRAVTARLREIILQLSSRQASAGVCLDRWFRTAATPKVAFGELETLLPLLPEGDRRVAVAACLRVHGEAVAAEKCRWRLWLAESLWHEEAFHEAALMLESLQLDTGSDRLPPSWIAGLASAGSENGRLATLLAEAALRDEFDDREAAAVTCIACPALLRHGISDSWDLLGAVEAQLPVPLIAWSRAVQEYWLEYGQPIPSGALLGDRRLSDPDDVLERLRAAYQEAANMSFRFPLGQFTWGRLFGPRGAMLSLVAAIATREPAMVERWLSDFDRQHLDPETLVDRTAAMVLQEHPNLRGQTIEGGRKREGYTKLGVVLEAARAWVLSERATAKLGESLLIERSQELGRRLQGSLPEVEALVLSWERSALYPAPLGRHLMTAVADLWKAQ